MAYVVYRSGDVYATDDGGTLHLRAVSDSGPARLTVGKTEQLLSAIEPWLTRTLAIDHPEGVPPFAYPTRPPLERNPAILRRAANSAV